MSDLKESGDWTPGKPVQLESQRLILKSLALADIRPDYLSWWADPEVQSGLNMPPRKWTMIDAQRHVARFNNRDSFHLGIYYRETGQLIGFSTTMCNITARTATRSTVIGDKAYWNMGLGQEIINTTFPFIFGRLNMHKMIARVEANNVASRRMSEAVGYSLEGILREEAPTPSGGRTDIYVYGLLKQEWEASKA